MDWLPIDVPVLGRSGLIALIALLHIPFFVNFVMGGPVIAVIAEWLGKRTGDPRYDRISRDLSMMTLVTVGIGAFGGVGLVATNIGLFPRFFSIGAQVFFWPLVIEIGAFLTEAIFIAIYRYTWDRMKHRPLHLLYGLLGAFGAWVSGLLINALASFMLTPGNWPQTKNLWDAVLNPSFLPSFIHRGVAALSITGFFLIAYALWRSRRAKSSGERDDAAWTLRFAGTWAFVSTAVQFFPGVWYLTAIERGTRTAAPEGSVVPKLLGGPITFFWFGGIILAALAILLVWFLAVRNPKAGLRRLGQAGLVLSIVLILLTNAFMGFTRERARKPYLVYGVIYGNEMMAKISEAMPGDTAMPSDREPGLEVFDQSGCRSCHSLQGEGGAIKLDGIGSRMDDADIQKIVRNPPKGMPAFGGSADDLQQLATFLANQRQGG